MIGYVAAGGLVLALAAGAGGYVKGRIDGADPWIEQTAALEAQLHQMQTDGDARAKRSEAIAAKATAELARVRKEAENDRAKWLAEATDGWSAYLDAERVRSTPTTGSDHEIALASCRADATAARGALSTVLDAAFAIRGVAVVNTRQLEQLQEWVREVTR